MSEHEGILEEFRKMTLAELAEFIEKFEQEFGVSAGAAPAAAGGAGAGDAAAEVPEEKTEFDVVLAGIGGKKIQVIKVVRSLTGLGLKEAKDLVEAAPKPVLEKVSKDVAEKAAEGLRAEGADVDLI